MAGYSPLSRLISVIALSRSRSTACPRSGARFDVPLYPCGGDRAGSYSGYITLAILDWSDEALEVLQRVQQEQTEGLAGAPCWAVPSRDTLSGADLTRPNLRKATYDNMTKGPEMLRPGSSEGSVLVENERAGLDLHLRRARNSTYLGRHLGCRLQTTGWQNQEIPDIKTFSMRSTAQLISLSVITRGGAKRMIFLWVSLQSNPLSISFLAY